MVTSLTLTTSRECGAKVEENTEGAALLYYSLWLAISKTRFDYPATGDTFSTFVKAGRRRALYVSRSCPDDLDSIPSNVFFENAGAHSLNSS